MTDRFVADALAFARMARHLEGRYRKDSILGAALKVARGRLLTELSEMPQISAAPVRRDALDALSEGLTQFPPEITDPEIAAGFIVAGVLWAERPDGDPGENTEQAITCFERALPALTPEADPLDWSVLRVNLGAAYTRRARGDPIENIEQAIGYYAQALLVQTRDADPHSWAQVRANLGVAFRERLRGDRADNLERAIECFEDALSILAHEGGRQQLSQAYENLGFTFRQRLLGHMASNIGQAIACFERALETFADEDDPSQRADILAGLGNAYTELPSANRAADIDRGITCLKTALEALSGEEAPLRRAVIFNDLGTAYAERLHGDKANNLDAAIAHFRNALQILTWQVDPYRRAQAMHNLGRAYEERLPDGRTEDAEQAIAAFEEAMPVLSRINPPFALGAAISVGALHLRLDQPAEACRRWREAMTMRAAQLTAGTSLVARAETARDSALLAPRLALLEAADVRHADALETLERGHALALHAALRLDDVWLASLPEERRTPIVASRKRLADLRRRPPAMQCNSDPRLVLAWEAEILAGEERLQAALAAAAYAPAPFSGAQTLTRLAPKDGAVVMLAAAEKGLAFVLPDAASAIGAEHFAELPGADAGTLRELVIRWNRAYGAMLAKTGPDASAAPSDLHNANAVLEDVLEYLWSEVMEPVAERLAVLGINPGAEILILPQGDFALLPLHAAGTNLAAGGHCFLDDFIVRYAPSGFAVHTAAARLARHRSLGFTDDAGLGRGLFGIFNPMAGTQDALPEAESEEMPALRSLFAGAGHDVAVYAGPEASLTQALGGAGKAGYVHFACHGRFEPFDPESSGLQLAGGSRLSVSTIVQDLRLECCRLVTLSACESGMVDVLHLPDEFIGLPAAFLQAGAPGVAATFWSVAEIPSAALMRRFYALHLAGNPPAAALRNAVLWLRDASKAPQMTNPSDAAGEISTQPMTEDMRQTCTLPVIWAAYAYHGI